MILWILLSLFGETLADCVKCAWPNVATVNQRGQCVVGVGLQSNLQNTCSNYCLLWASDVITTIPYVVSSDNSGTCICQRQASGSSSVEYKTRAKRTCVNVGPTDDEINSWKDKPAAYQSSISEHVWFPGSMTYDRGGSAMSFVGNFTDATGKNYGMSIFGNLPVDDIQFAIARKLGQFHSQTLFPLLNTSFSHIDSSLNMMADTLATALANSRNAVTGQQLQDAFLDLRYAINTRSGGGGSSTTDLSGVYSALAAARDANLQATVSVGDSVHAMAGRVSASLSELQASINGVGDSVSGLGSKISYMGKMVDSGANARWMMDNAFRDSASLADSASASSIYDSARRVGSGAGSWSADSSAEFSAALNSANFSASSIASELDRMKSDLISGGCSDFPSWTVTVMHTTLDLGAGFNAYPEIFTLLRFLGRFFGAFLGFKTISAVLGVKKEE